MGNFKSAEEIGRKWLRVFVVAAMLSAGFGLIYSGFKDELKTFEIRAEVVKKENLQPDEPAVIYFSGPVRKESVSASLSINPPTEVNLEWSEKNRKLSISPKYNWKNGKTYAIVIERGENFLGMDFKENLSFSVEDFPKVVSISPSKGEKNVLIDIEDPIMISFDKSIKDYNVKVSFSPMGNFSHELNEEKNVLKIMPTESLEYGKRYDVFVVIKHKKSVSEEEFENIFESNFETKKLEIKEWSKDTSVRLFQAKNYTEAMVAEGKYIDINLKSQVMVIFESGQALDSFLISSGRSGMNTPDGNFKIFNKHPRPWSKKYSLFMPYWMAITSTGEFGIHELPEWPGGYKEGANHLGIPVSHGCVRLGIGPAEKVYNWADIGTPVVIHY